jgi:hypothetical protein
MRTVKGKNKESQKKNKGNGKKTTEKKKET